MKKLLTLFAVLTFTVSTAWAQCIIHGAEIVQGYCNNAPHQYTHHITIDGSAENTGSQGWEIITPNDTSGPHPYNQHPISNQANFFYILPIEDEYCGEAFWVTIRDVEFPDCSWDFYYEPRHCCCDIKNILVDTICTGPGQYQLRVDLEITGGDPVNPTFDLILQTDQGFGLFSGNFPLADLPVTIGPFEAEGQGLVVIAEKTGVLDYCTQQREVPPMFCMEPECALTHILTDTFPCDPSDQTYYTELDFQFENPGSLGFSLYDDYCECSFEYQYSDLPLVLGPYPGDCQTNIRYTITDLELGCEATHLMEAACCNPSNQCTMTGLVLDTLCMGTDSFMILVDFTIQNGGANGFALFLNGDSISVFAYTDLPVQIGPLPADCQTAYQLHVEDVLDPTCKLETAIQAPCCYPVCSISDLLLTPSCLSEDSMTLFIDFEVANGSPDGFELWLNDSLIAILDYSARPYEMDPLYTDCATSYIISVVDRQDPHCSIDALLDEACCAMLIPQFSVWEIDTICHAGSSFELVMQFDVSQPGAFGWQVQVNDTQVGPFSYDEPFPVLGPFDIDCEGPVSVILYDVQHPAGREEQEIADLCCLSSHADSPSSAQVQYRMLPSGLLVLENELPMPVAWSLHNILGQPIVGRRSLEAGARVDFQLPSVVAGLVILHIDSSEGLKSVLFLIH
jgi:hypothetical protein